jgi:hypothetical protein
MYQKIATIPATIVSNSDSPMNCPNSVVWFAPIAFLTPIS